MNLVTPNGRIGTPHWRVEGVAKVTGKALYGADQRPVLGAGSRVLQSSGEPTVEQVSTAPMVYAAAVTAPIATGRIKRMNDAKARSMPGVLEVLTYKNVGRE